MKMSRKLLEKYRKLKKEIPILELELQEMVQGHNGFGNSVVLDYRTGKPRPQSVVGFDWMLYERRRQVLEGKRAQVTAVEDWISAIEHGQTRCVFRMFYIDGLTWEKIAMKTGYSGSPDYPRLYIRDAYLKKCRIN